MNYKYNSCFVLSFYLFFYDYFRALLPLSELLWNLGIPLIVTKSIGFIGYLRIQFQEHVVIESHPDSQNPDLRLDKPFPSLSQYVDSFDLDTMDLKDHAHIPYVVPLLKALNEWRQSHNLALPSNFKEKEELRQLIRKGNIITFYYNYFTFLVVF